MEEIDDLEQDYYDLGKSPSILNFEAKRDLADKKNKFVYDFQGNLEERVLHLEEKVREMEKAFSLINENFKELRNYFDAKINSGTGKIPPNIKEEIETLKSLVEKTNIAKEEIMSKFPNILRELETKIEKNSIDLAKSKEYYETEIKKIKEEINTNSKMDPVIIE